MRVGCRNKQKGEEKKLKIPDRTKAITRRGQENRKEKSGFSLGFKKKKAFRANGCIAQGEKMLFFFRRKQQKWKKQTHKPNSLEGRVLCLRPANLGIEHAAPGRKTVSGNKTRNSRCPPRSETLSLYWGWRSVVEKDSPSVSMKSGHNFPLDQSISPTILFITPFALEEFCINAQYHCYCCPSPLNKGRHQF